MSAHNALLRVDLLSIGIVSGFPGVANEMVDELGSDDSIFCLMTVEATISALRGFSFKISISFLCLVAKVHTDGPWRIPGPKLSVYLCRRFCIYVIGSSDGKVTNFGFSVLQKIKNFAFMSRNVLTCHMEREPLLS